MVDCIACLACDRFEMDAWGVDVMVTGCQKGLMTPPGMAFVYFNAKADAVRETRRLRDALLGLAAARPIPDEFYQYFDGTAPTHHLYGLREALDMIAEEGLENVWARHEKLAAAVWAAFEAWGTEGPVQLNIADRAKRSVRGDVGPHRRAARHRSAQLADRKGGCHAGHRSGHGGVRTIRPGTGSFASPTWATSTATWCWAHWARSRPG